MATPLSSVEIRVEKKFSKMAGAIQAQSVGDQLALLIYGKRLTASNANYPTAKTQGGVLGQKQNILKSKVEGKTITVYISSSWTDELANKHTTHIKSMVRHAQSNSVNISLVVE